MSHTLVVSDVHANAPALEAVLAAEPDRDSVVFLGDAVDNGPHPEAVCERLRGLEIAAGVRGNHDRDVLRAADPTALRDDPYADWKEWTYDRLSVASREFLTGLDRTTSIAFGDRSVRLHHGDFPRPEDYDGAWSTRATPADDRILFETVADQYDEDVILHGHSHYPYEATVAGTRFVNPGSIGLQRPGWPVDHARYAVFEDGSFELRSVPYETAAVTRDLRELDSPFYENWKRSTANANTV